MTTNEPIAFSPDYDKILLMSIEQLPEIPKDLLEQFSDDEDIKSAVFGIWKYLDSLSDGVETPDLAAPTLEKLQHFGYVASLHGMRDLARQITEA